MINSWKKIKLKDCVDLLTGFAFKSEKFTNDENDIPLVKGDNLHQKYIDWENAKRWDSRDYDRLEKFHLKEGDIVLAMDRPWIEAGLKYAWIKKNDPKSLLVQRISRMRGINGLTTSYLRYIVGSPHFCAYLKNIVTGVNVPHISGRQILNYEVDIPNNTTQKKIASILSVYDDLIENNNQRIQLLEEMAEDIYKEWFVRMRFPATENSPSYKDSKFFDKEENEVPHGTIGALPKGWERKAADEFDSFSKSETKLRKFKGEKRYLATADITEIKITGEGERISWYNKPSRAQLTPEMNSVFFARMSNTYKVLNFTESNFEFIDELALSSGFFGLKAKTKLCFPYLFTLIKGKFFHDNKDVYSNGATQVSLTNEGFHMIKLIEPKIDLIEKFGELTYHFYDEINILMKKNQVLQKTRDLLLTRLISGKLKVEGLEIESEEGLSMAAETAVDYK